MQVSAEDLQKELLTAGLVSEGDFIAAQEDAQKHARSLASALVDAGKITEDQLHEVYSRILNIPFVDLTKEKIDHATLLLIPEPIARKHNIVAYKQTQEAVFLAMLDVENLPLIDSIKKTIDRNVVVHMTNKSSIDTAIAQYRKSLNAEFDDIIQKEVSSVADSPQAVADNASSDELKKLAEDLPIIKIVDTLISHAILQNASDIHMEPEEEALMIRYRVDGILHDAVTLPKKITAAVIVRVKVLANLRLDEKRLPQDGRFKTTFDGQDVSFRVSTLPTYFGEKIVIRLLRETSHGLSLEALGLHGEGLEHIHSAMSQKTGLLLVTGPTGSGKTTTLYTMLDILNTPDVNISTVEDPIEYQVARINQTQVRADIGLTFANGLRSLLRQDPDIIMVGEVRDKETASLAVNAALTGHLVLSTLHTSSAAGAIPRLIDMGVETFLIVSTIKSVSAQRLVRVLFESKEKYFLSEQERADLEQVVDMSRVLDYLKKEKIVAADATWETVPFYRPVPTPEHESGYSGRIGIHEVLHITDSMKQVINGGATEAEIEKLAKEEGMLTMIEDGIFKAVQGITTTEEVLRVISE